MPLLSKAFKDERRPLRIACCYLGVICFLLLNLWLNAEVRARREARAAKEYRGEWMRARLEQIDFTFFRPPQTEPEGDTQANCSENPVAGTNVSAGGRLSSGRPRQ